MKKEWYEEVRCNYNNEEGFWCVDAWKPNTEQGEVIAAIHETTGDIFYIDPMARISPLAQEVIKEKIKEIKKNDLA